MPQHSRRFVGQSSRRATMTGRASNLRLSARAVQIPALVSVLELFATQMPSFEDIGLREELLRTLEDEEIAEPTGLQESVIPVLRRGGNVVARASSGSGKTLAYALGVLDRLKVLEDAEGEDRSELRVLILTPTPAEAERVAIAITPYAQALGMTVAAVGRGWGTPPNSAGILSCAIGDAMDSIRASAIKLESVETLIVDGAAAIQELGDWDQVDGLIDLIPRDAQRVIITASVTAAVEDLIDRRVKRALRHPAEPAIPERAAAAPESTITYVVISEREKLDLLAAQLREREGGNPPIVFCRTDERAADLAEQLTVRGFVVGSADDEEADLVLAAGGATREDMIEEAEADVGQTISFDVPADARTLLARHGGDPDAVVLVQPREIAHIREIASQAAYRARSAPPPVDASAAAAKLKSFRNEIRRAVQEEDLAAQLLVLEPLLDEFAAIEVAAALASLLRSRRPTAPAAPTAPTAQPSPRATGEKSPEAGPAPVTWARLFVGVGTRDEIRPGDLVGALAGEANIPGTRIGKIEIRDNFSIVEVQADVADQVIRAVNGTTMKGRAVRVDYDRGGPARRPPQKGGPARRTTRRPPSS